jgi:shikimate kinase
VLVGLPGAGKSTVGPLVARRLGRPFLDLDAELERRVGRTVAAQFAEDGEAAFRAREAALSGELAGRTDPPLVLAPGGGWMVNTAALLALGRVARTIYLRVRPETAARRLAADGVVRPLVAGAADPVRAVAALLARRGAVYEAADGVIEADVRSPEAVAEAVATLVGVWEAVDRRSAAPAAPARPGAATDG